MRYIAKIEDTAVPFPYSDRSLDWCTSSTWNLLYIQGGRDTPQDFDFFLTYNLNAATAYRKKAEGSLAESFDRSRIRMPDRVSDAAASPSARSHSSDR